MGKTDETNGTRGSDKPSENRRNIIRKSMENHWKTSGKLKKIIRTSQENHRKTSGKPQEKQSRPTAPGEQTQTNQRKTWGEPMENLRKT